MVIVWFLIFTGKEIAMIPKVSSKMAYWMICCMASLKNLPTQLQTSRSSIYMSNASDQTGHKGWIKKCGMSMVK